MSFGIRMAVWEHRPVLGRDQIVAALSEALGGDQRIAAAYLFGSFTRGQATALSDVDVALVVADRCSALERAAAVVEVATKLAGTAPGVTFDVHALADLPTAVSGRVVNEGELVFESDPSARVRAEVAARMAYLDFEWLERSTLAEGLEGLRRRFDRG